MTEREPMPDLRELNLSICNRRIWQTTVVQSTQTLKAEENQPN